MIIKRSVFNTHPLGCSARHRGNRCRRPGWSRHRAPARVAGHLPGAAARDACSVRTLWAAAQPWIAVQGPAPSPPGLRRGGRQLQGTPSWSFAQGSWCCRHRWNRCCRGLETTSVEPRSFANSVRSTDSIGTAVAAAAWFCSAARSRCRPGLVDNQRVKPGFVDDQPSLTFVQGIGATDPAAIFWLQFGCGPPGVSNVRISL